MVNANYLQLDDRDWLVPFWRLPGNFPVICNWTIEKGCWFFQDYQHILLYRVDGMKIVTIWFGDGSLSQGGNKHWYQSLSVDNSVGSFQLSMHWFVPLFLILNTNVKRSQNICLSSVRGYPLAVKFIYRWIAANKSRVEWLSLQITYSSAMVCSSVKSTLVVSHLSGRSINRNECTRPLPDSTMMLQLWCHY